MTGVDLGGSGGLVEPPKNLSKNYKISKTGK